MIYKTKLICWITDNCFNILFWVWVCNLTLTDRRLATSVKIFHRWKIKYVFLYYNRISLVWAVSVISESQYLNFIITGTNGTSPFTFRGYHQTNMSIKNTLALSNSLKKHCSSDSNSNQAMVNALVQNKKWPLKHKLTKCNTTRKENIVRT